MTDQPAGTDDSEHVALIVRRTIRAPADRVFDAWTSAEQVRRWWGPRGVTCPGAEIDLRVGGQYRIGNQLPDGKVSWVSGEFEVVEPPSRLVYTWGWDGASAARERVTVRFEPRGEATEVIVVHERITDPKSRDLHEQGWTGCLEGLDAYVVPAPGPR